MRVLIDLAEHNSENYTPMKEIAARQGLSQKYLEQIMPVLIKNKIVDGMSGKGAGFLSGVQGRKMRALRGLPNSPDVEKVQRADAGFFQRNYSCRPDEIRK